MIKFEPLTRTILNQLDDVPVSVKGIAVVKDDKPIGFVAVTLFTKEKYCFMRAEGVPNKAIIQAWKLFKEQLTFGFYYAVRDPEFPTSDGFLRHFGFTPFEDDLYWWRHGVV